jgi:mannosyl-3-phosphoglycerate phosphatase
VTARRLVVTGIDGCLFDPLTRDCDPVRPGMAALSRLGVPLVLCSARTRAEVTFVGRLFGLAAPVVAENGAVLLVPEGHLRAGAPGAERDGEWLVLRLGPRRETLKEALRQAAAAAGVTPRLLSDLTADERAGRGVLAGLFATAAPAREHTEPFLLEGDEEPAALAREAESRGLRLVRGQRFWHLCGGADKGLALRTLLALYEREGPVPETIGLGVWPIDLPMLRSVHRPIALPGPDGSVDPALSAGLAGAERAWHGGPSGWTDAVLAALAGRRLPPLAPPSALAATRPLPAQLAAS